MAEKPIYRNQLDFLEKEGYLHDASTEADLTAGKKAWRKYYKREHRKVSKQRRPEVTVIFPDYAMYEQIKAEAERHNRSMSRFMWECAQKYLKQQFLQTQPEKWDAVQQNIELARLSIQQIQAEVEDGHQTPYSANNLLLEKLLELQEKLEQTLNQSELIAEAIEQLLIKEPWQKETLLKLIENL